MHFQILFHRFRWLHLPTTFLVMLLQRTPVLRVLAADGPGFALRSADILKSAFALAALGAYDSVTGATAFNSTVVSPTTASPASASARSTVKVGGVSGSAFSLAINVTGAPSTAKSWKVTGTLPSGISVSGGTASGSAIVYNGLKVTLAGTPAATSTGNFTVTAYDSLNATGNNTSVTCALTITGPTGTAPVFSQHPASQTVTVGDNVTFTTTVTGSPAPTLQWYKDGQALSGKTSASLTLSKVQLAAAGDYKLVATNASAPSGVPSNIATLTVNEPPPVAPVFTTQPASQTVVAGSAVIFSSVVTGTPAPTLQWYKDGEALSGKTSATLTLNTVQPSAAGDYTVVATNTGAPSGVPSKVATLTVNYAPSFSLSPESQTVGLGSTVILYSAASGYPTPTFIWRKDGIILAGQSGPELTISPVTFADAGRYLVTASNAVSSVPALAATLSVIVPAPAAISDPGSLRTGSEISWDLSGGAPVPTSLVYKAAGLPGGLKLDSATGHITGLITAAARSFTVSTWAQVGATKSIVNTTTLAIGAFPAELVGSYEALLRTEDDSALPAGKVSLKVATNGTFTGKLLADDLAAFSLSGRLALSADNSAGSATLTLSRGKILPAYLLHATVSSAAPALSATLSAGAANIGSSADGAKLLSAAPAGAAGPYTLLLAAPANLGSVSEFPLGDGYATATIAANGNLTLSGKNADGTKLTGAYSLGADNSYRIYAKPYALIGGYVAGVLPLSPRADNPARWHVASETGSDLYWRKPDPVAVTTSYSDGFGPLGLDARLEPWTKLSLAAPLAPLLGLGTSGNLDLSIAATGLANETSNAYGLPRTLALSATNAITVVGDNRSALFTAKINAASGALTGSFTLKAIPPVAKRTVSYAGVMLQTAPADQPGLAGGGFFLLPAAVKGGPVLSGKVELATPSPAP